MKLGLITYDHTHLKTEQLATKYSQDNRINSVEIFALPFSKRKEREVIITHRPDMATGLSTEVLDELESVSFQRWDGKQKIGNMCDVFVIGGAGILDIAFSEGKPIVNAHPGIIPLTRGLDSFKWAIYNGDPLGITLHLIDSEVDKGDILSIQHTPVFSTDSIETLARRHYELEIDMLANVIDVLHRRVKSPYQERVETMRMNNKTEKEATQKFEEWKMSVISSIPAKNTLKI